MCNSYSHMKARQQLELKAILNDDNYISGTNVYQIPDGFVRVVGLGLVKADIAPTIKSMIARFSDEMREAIAADTTGKDFILPMYMHECETQKSDPNKYLLALGFSFSEIWGNPIMKNCLLKVQELYLNQASVLS